MGFLSAASAWFALALPAIAAMYILKRTYENTEISSHLLWRRVLQEQEANRPWQRLRSRWLLLLQLLATLLLVLALMGPYMKGASHASGDAVLLIDRSASMTARSAENGGVTRFELALRQAERWIDEQAGNRAITIVAAGALPEVLVAKESNKAELKRQLGTIVPFYGKSDNAAALSLSDSLLQGSAEGSIVLFTDGHWTDAAEGNKLGLQAALDLHPIDDEKPVSNWAIIYFGIASDPSGAGDNTATITVRNDSASEGTIAVEIYAAADGGELQLAGEASVNAAAGEWQSADVGGLPDARYYKALIRGGDDEVTADNAMYAFPSVPRTTTALLVSEGNLFLEKALLLAGVKPVKISPDGAPPSAEQAESIDWIILDGSIDRLRNDKEWAKLLTAHPLWMIDHPEAGDAAAAPAHTRVETKDHPVVSYITFADTFIGRFAKPAVEEVSWGEQVLTYGGIPAIYAGVSGGKPQLRFTFDLQNSDLPLRPEFPVLIVQASEWMSGGSRQELGSAEADQHIELALRSDTEQAVWETIELAGAGLPSEGTKGETRIADLSGSGQFAAPSVPGLYKLIERNKAGEATAERLLAVTANAAELSGLHAKPEQLNPAVLQGEAGGDSAANNDAAAGRQSLVIWAVLFMLLVMAAEWEVYRRGYTS